MLRRERGRTEGDVLTDSTDPGKAALALTVILRGARDRERRNGKVPVAAREPHRPTLVLVPARAISTWISQWRADFGEDLDLWLYHGTRAGTGDLARRGLVVDDADLRDRERRGLLDPLRARAAHVVVLTTSATWARRHADPRPRARPEVEEGRLEGWRDRFHRVICDAGGRVRDPGIACSRFIRRLNAPHLWFLVATSSVHDRLHRASYVALLQRVARIEEPPLSIGPHLRSEDLVDHCVDLDRASIEPDDSTSFVETSPSRSDTGSTQRSTPAPSPSTSSSSPRDVVILLQPRSSLQASRPSSKSRHQP